MSRFLCIALVLIFFFGSAVLTEAKELKSEREKWENLFEFYDEIARDKEDEYLISLLQNKLPDLPDKFDDEKWIEISAMINVLGERGSIQANPVIEEYVDKISNMCIDFTRGRINYCLGAKHIARVALLRIEMVEKRKVSNIQKYEFLLEKLKNEKADAGPIVDLLEKLPPGITQNRLLKLLDGDNEKLKIFALEVLEESGSPQIQDRIIDLMEKEIKKPNYGLYIYASRVLDSVGDKKSYKYALKMLKTKDPVIRKVAIYSLDRLHDRGIIDDNELIESLEPLLMDENSEVVERAQYILKKAKPNNETVNKPL